MSRTVERGQCGVVSAEIAEQGQLSLPHESPHAHARRGGRDATPPTESTSTCRPDQRHGSSGGSGDVLRYAESVEPLIARIGPIGTLLKRWRTERHEALCAEQEANWKPSDRLEPGDRVVMRAQALYVSRVGGGDIARVWTVAECACELCQSGRLVAVDQWVADVGWRHIAKVALRHYGQPSADELPVACGSADTSGTWQGGVQ